MAIGQGVKFAILLPFYNAEETLDGVCKDLQEVRKAYGDCCLIIAINDGSTDRSQEIVGHRILSLAYEKNVGIGHALKIGVQEAIERGCEFVVHWTASGKFAISDLHYVISFMQAGDMFIQGSRYLVGGNTNTVPSSRKLALGLANFVFRLITGRKDSTDPVQGIKAYRLHYIKQGLLNVNKKCLNRYQYEFYVLCFFLYGGLYQEFATSVSYSHLKKRYTHVTPFFDYFPIIWRLLVIRLSLAIGRNPFK